MTDTAAVVARERSGRVGFGRRPALIIIDFVNGFLYGADTGEGSIAAAARRTAPLLDAAREARLPVIYTRIVYAEDGSDAGVWTRKAPRLLGLTESAEASQIIASLAPLPGERIVRKTQASAFFGTDLATYLIGRRVDTLIFAGCTTSGCVRATVVDAISHNFRPIVVADCVGDRAGGRHAANLGDIAEKYADVVPSGSVLRRLAEAPAAT